MPGNLMQGSRRSDYSGRSCMHGQFDVIMIMKKARRWGFRFEFICSMIGTFH